MGRTRPIHVVAGGLAGGLAFAVGFALALLLATPSTGDALFEISAAGQSQTIPWQDSDAGPAAWKVAGWLFHEAHFAETQVSTEVSGSTLTLVEFSFAQAPSLALHLVPVVLLLAAGVLLAAMGSGGHPLHGIVQGALVVVGYLPMAGLSVVFLRWEQTSQSGLLVTSMSAHPGLFSGIALTGITFPVVLGGLGGLLGSVLGR